MPCVAYVPQVERLWSTASLIQHNVQRIKVMRGQRQSSGRVIHKAVLSHTNSVSIDIWDSHGDDYKDSCRLRCDAV
jgi:hypothetical protein